MVAMSFDRTAWRRRDEVCADATEPSTEFAAGAGLAHADAVELVAGVTQEGLQEEGFEFLRQRVVYELRCVKGIEVPPARLKAVCRACQEAGVASPEMLLQVYGTPAELATITRRVAGAGGNPARDVPVLTGPEKSVLVYLGRSLKEMDKGSASAAFDVAAAMQKFGIGDIPARCAPSADMVLRVRKLAASKSRVVPFVKLEATPWVDARWRGMSNCPVETRHSGEADDDEDEEGGGKGNKKNDKKNQNGKKEIKLSIAYYLAALERLMLSYAVTGAFGEPNSSPVLKCLGYVSLIATLAAEHGTHIAILYEQNTRREMCDSDYDCEAAARSLRVVDLARLTECTLATAHNRNNPSGRNPNTRKGKDRSRSRRRDEKGGRGTGTTGGGLFSRNVTSKKAGSS
jgi:hypothetical protein